MTRPPNITAHPIRDQLQAGGAEAARAVATLRAAIEETDGNVSHAAEALGIGRATLNRWLAGLPELAELAADLRAASGHAAGRGAGAQREARGLVDRVREMIAGRESVRDRLRDILQRDGIMPLPSIGPDPFEPRPFAHHIPMVPRHNVPVILLREPSRVAYPPRVPLERHGALRFGPKFCGREPPDWPARGVYAARCRPCVGGYHAQVARGTELLYWIGIERGEWLRHGHKCRSIDHGACFGLDANDPERLLYGDVGGKLARDLPDLPPEPPILPHASQVWLDRWTMEDGWFVEHFHMGSWIRETAPTEVEPQNAERPAPAEGTGQA